MKKKLKYIDTGKVLWKETEGMVTLLAVADGEFYELNALGSRVWLLLAKNKTPQQIVKLLAPHYNVPLEVLSRDIDIFMQGVRSLDLLKEAA